MRRGSILCLLFVVVGIGCVSMVAQDIAKVAPKNVKILKETSQVRVIQDTIAPGEKEALHSHPAGWYYVVSPGTLKSVFADGKVEMWEAKPGEGGWIDGEGPHTSENVGKTPVTYVLVEIKGAHKPAAKTPAAPAKK